MLGFDMEYPPRPESPPSEPVLLGCGEDLCAECKSIANQWSVHSSIAGTQTERLSNLAHGEAPSEENLPSCPLSHAYATANVRGLFKTSKYLVLTTAHWYALLLTTTH